MDLNQALANAVRQLHEPGGRAVGTPRVPGDTVEVVVVAAIVYDRVVTVRVYRFGQTVNATGLIPWKGSVVPVVGARATLTSPRGSLNCGWVTPQTVAPA